jgi:hypothetical protein
MSGQVTKPERQGEAVDPGLLSKEKELGVQPSGRH